jgi:4-diphosphocytidyl-2-C-methyl-D-erythritol kinase
MYISRSATGLVVQAPAKVNLFFEVLGKRADGFHEIETLMCPVDLFDTLYFEANSSGQIELQCQRVGGCAGDDGGRSPELPEGRDNLVWRAADMLRERAGVVQGAALRLVKRIPTAAGLGGGSSDAAAALAVANRGWKLGWSPAELTRLAAELGSDVPFFLAGGPAVCRGRGERVEVVEGMGPLHFVVVRPPAGLATAAVYAVCRPAAVPQPLGPILDALKRGDIEQSGRLLLNRLEPAAETLSPWIARLRREFDRTDCPGHGMSGSGTSYFGLCRHARHARRIARRLAANLVGSVFAVRSCR